MWENPAAFYEVRTHADPQAMAAALRQVVQETAPTLPPIEVRTMSGLVDDSPQTDRFIEQLASAFSLLALLLAAIGLYGIPPDEGHWNSLGAGRGARERSLAGPSRDAGARTAGNHHWCAFGAGWNSSGA